MQDALELSPERLALWKAARLLQLPRALLHHSLPARMHWVVQPYRPILGGPYLLHVDAQLLGDALPDADVGFRRHAALNPAPGRLAHAVLRRALAESQLPAQIEDTF